MTSLATGKAMDKAFRCSRPGKTEPKKTLSAVGPWQVGDALKVRRDRSENPEVLKPWYAPIRFYPGCVAGNAMA